MATIEESIYSRLSGFAGLTALVSTRIYANQLPQNATLPAVTYSRISALRPSAMGEDTDIVKARFQFDCWCDQLSSGSSPAYEVARNVREQVRAAMQRWGQTSPVLVWDSFIISEVDLFEEDVEMHHLVIDVEINYNEA